jgi:hypothetical protein
MRQLVLEQLKAHIADMDRLGDALEQWRDRAVEQSLGADAAMGGGGGSRRRPTLGPAPFEPARPAARVNPEEEDFRRSVEGFLATNALRLSAITRENRPSLATWYGLTRAGAIPYYSEAGIRAGDTRPVGQVRLGHTDELGRVYLVEKTTPGIAAERAPADLIILRPTADLVRLEQDARRLAAARAGRGQPRPATTRVASTRPR